MTEPLFSIVIPSFNYALTLPRAVESVLSQEGEDFELLVVNDGSTDETDGVIQSLLAETDNAFRYIKQENAGPAATRNAGIEAGSGRFFIFLDADDEMAVNALEYYREQIIKTPRVGMIAGGHLSRDENGREKAHLPGALPASKYKKLQAYLLDKTVSFSNGAVTISSSVFDSYRYPERFRSSEDIPMFAHILANYEVTIIDSSLAIIYKHSDSLRHNVGYVREVGLAVVSEVFDTERIPPALLSLKEAFMAQRSLSLFRTLYGAGKYKEARKYYHRAIAIVPTSLFQFSYLRKYLKSWF